MTIRAISGIIFALIVAAELYFYLSLPLPTTTERTGSGKWAGTRIVADYQAIEKQNQKHMIIIGATILVGGIVIFSLPNKITIKHKEEAEQ